MRTKLDVDLLFIVLGAIMINIALDYGAGVEFGWWGLLFYAGLGLIIGELRR